ncbi:hypothetical protein VB773_14160 [Haloarculaceae archaeon H-GB2-1]|nr:hypothetical protein [Haloarculaceae archaeon H-GB1-1]MEA5408599.1 hypothetical protein [Haloarculaceae archaeon H-GB2-1]
MSMRGQRTTVELSENDSVEIVATPDSEYHRRLDVERDGYQWTFGVDSDRDVELLRTKRNGRLAKLDVPEWMDDVLRYIGLGGGAE